MSANSCESKTIVGSHTHTYTYTQTLLSSVLCCSNDWLLLQHMQLDRFLHQNRLSMCMHWNIVLAPLGLFFLHCVLFKLKMWSMDCSWCQSKSGKRSCLYIFISYLQSSKERPPQPHPLIRTDKNATCSFCRRKDRGGSSRLQNGICTVHQNDTKGLKHKIRFSPLFNFSALYCCYLLGLVVL